MKTILAFLVLGFLALEATATEVQCSRNDNQGPLELLPNPDDCTSYYVCDWGKPIRMYCAPETRFDKNRLQCIFIGDAECAGPEEPVIPLRRSLSADEEVVCEGNNEGLAELHPNPKNCSTYYVCNWGNPILMPCPADMAFDAILSVCVRAEDARCGTLGRKTALVNKPSFQVRDVKCQQNNEGDAEHIPDPEDCDCFYMCVWGTPIQRCCAPGTKFDKNKLVCVDPNDVVCAGPDSGEPSSEETSESEELDSDYDK